MTMNDITALILRYFTEGHQLIRHTVISSNGQLVTQSTRHKRAHNKATSGNFFYLHAGQVAPRNSAQRTRTAYLRQACNIEVTDDGEALEWDEC